MNQTHKVLHDDTLRMFPQQGTSFPRHLMIAFRTLAGPTSQILQLASLTRCHRQEGWKHCRVQSILGSSCTTEKYGTALQPTSRPLQCPVKSCLFAQQCTHCPPLSQIRQSSDQSLTAFGHAPKIPQI